MGCSGPSPDPFSDLLAPFRDPPIPLSELSEPDPVPRKLLLGSANSDIGFRSLISVLRVPILETPVPDGDPVIPEQDLADRKLLFGNPVSYFRGPT